MKPATNKSMRFSSFGRIRSAVLRAAAALSAAAMFQTAPEASASEDPVVSGKKLSEWIGQLSDFDAEFRMQALNAIGKLDKDLAAPARDAVQRVAEDKRSTRNVRAKAAFVLITRFGIEEPSAIDDLFEVLSYSEADRGWAMGALTQYKQHKDEIINAAIKVLKNPRLDIRVKAPVGVILRQIGPSVVPKLAELRGNLSDSATTTVVDGLIAEFDPSLQKRTPSQGDSTRLLIGTWQAQEGSPVLVTFMPDGDLKIADPRTGQPLGGTRRWQLQGNELTFVTTWSRNTYPVISLTETELVLRHEHDQGLDHYRKASPR
jgi:hypothetical protein